ncbi:hypothetical protein DNTS_003133 [Danionella cerebrum]|uniref:CDAN1-interacting nuclease 1 n=1 Tax=Danionella cerebrum TaxID=2873325 RepID=A0A553NGK5_9TELE|nr:hypothetical protein DNTS_003133 [Danionella translucida]
MKRTFARHQAPDTVTAYYHRYRSESAVRPEAPLLLELANQSLSNAINREFEMVPQPGLEEWMDGWTDGCSSSRLELNKLLREPQLIPDQLLARHVEQCIVNDCCYGPLVDCIKQYPDHKLCLCTCASLSPGFG